MYQLIQGDAENTGLPDKSVDLVLGSPPYCEQRTYLENGQNIGIARTWEDWIEWMIRVTHEGLRVSRGLVIWVAACPTRDKNYMPACEGLMYEWRKRGGHLWRPCIWYRVGIPGSGHKQWFRADTEYCMAFKREGDLPYADNTACGHPPKWGCGGEMSNRKSDGTRVNRMAPLINSGATVKNGDFVRSEGKRPSHYVVTHREKDGSRRDKEYGPPVLANPGNFLEIEFEDWEFPNEYLEPSVIRHPVGGGLLGHPLSHSNEAPYPEALASFFIKSFVPVGGTVADFFSGSGTTCAAAEKLGRNSIGIDLRESQIKIARERLENPNMKKPSKRKNDGENLFGSAA